MHLEALPLTPLGAGVGVIVGSVIAQTPAVAGGGENTQLLVIAVIAGASTGIAAALSAFITGHFANKTAMAIAAMSAHAQEAAIAAKAATDATKELGDKTDVMSGRLDGKLEELLRLTRSEAHAQGRQEAQVEAEEKAAGVLAQTKVDAATVRADAKEDRAEGALQQPVRIASPETPGSQTNPIHTVVDNAQDAPVNVKPSPPQ